MPQYAVSFINSQYLGENYILSYFFLPLVDYFFFSFLTAIWSRANFQLSDRFRSDICIDFIWDCRLVRLWQLTSRTLPWEWRQLELPLDRSAVALISSFMTNDRARLRWNSKFEGPEVFKLRSRDKENPDISHDYYYLCILFRPLLRHIHLHWIGHRCLMETLETATRLHPTVCSFF